MKCIFASSIAAVLFVATAASGQQCAVGVCTPPAAAVVQQSTVILESHTVVSSGYYGRRGVFARRGLFVRRPLRGVFVAPLRVFRGGCCGG